RLNIVQLGVYSTYIDTAGIKQSLAPAFNNISFFQLNHGVGIILHLDKAANYRADAYPDGASSDLLLALTKTSEKKLAQAVKSQKGLAWAPELDPIANAEPAEPVTVNRTSYNKLKEKLKIDVIVLDPGHGGHDVGAIGYSGHYEKDIVLAIAKKVGHYINKYMPNVKVVYTRTGDYYVGEKKHPGISHMQSLIERGQIANR